MSYSEEMLDALNDQDLEEAKKKFASALRHDDDDTLFSLAEELQALGFNQQTRRIAEKLLAKYPDADDVRLILAELDIGDDKTDEALLLLDQISGNSAVYPQSLLTAADLYQSINLPEVSERKLLEAKVLLPDEPVVDFALGELYLNQGRYQDALSYYQSLLDQKVDFMAQVSIQQRLAETLSGLGEYEEAIAIDEKLTENLATDEQLFELGVLYQQVHDDDKAIQVLTRLQQQNSDYSALYRPLVQSQSDLGRYQQALQAAQVGLGYDEYNLDLYRLGAQAALKVGAKHEAEELLKKGLSLDPEAQSLRLMLAQHYLETGHDQDSVDLLAPLADEDEADPQVNWQLAQAYDHLDDPELAKQNYFAAYPNLKDNSQFMKQMVIFLQSQAMTPELKLALQQYLKLVPDDADFEAMLLDLEADDNQF
ncbi:tetratricopeptide repeat protein [Lapidilactobacillus mulanensis]|uniref:Tetratricopeptide repeat protein n=1 Tax=Lapidilactobacillus mulanensis TaxID=2485999 RepID=A0ABW4DRC9_9LACO|nr:tetratricopeptide repeat protein [Lapidilactobacillus mulanensis]